MCVDYIDLNRECPKDNYPFSWIDQLVNTTLVHELLTFMDVFSRYSQIRIISKDREHISFITDRGMYCYRVMPIKNYEGNIPKDR